MLPNDSERSPQISIAMATYSGADYLEAQLESLVQQTRLPAELVVFDDQSSDATIEILERFKRTAPFRMYLSRNVERVGYAANFARALSACRGDMIFLCDQDDFWLPQKIQTVSDWFDRDPRDQVLVHDLEFCDSALQPIGQRKIERMASYTDPQESYVTGAATAVRRRFLQILFPFPNVEFIGHDDWIHQCAHLIGGKEVLPDVLALYRRHGANATVGTALNAARVTTRKEFTAGHATSNTRPTLHTRIVTWQLLADWLTKHKAILVENGYLELSRCNELSEMMERKVRWAKQRYRNLALPKYMRAVPVLVMLAQGGYSIFSGVKSAAKDIIVN